MYHNKTTKGFTIVELLIVVVVIAILAAITIVSYNGITARANAASANSLATHIVKKIETYRASTSQIPTFDQLQNNKAVGSTVVNSGPQEARIDAASISSTAPGPTNGTSVVRYVNGGCGNIFVDYWDYTNNRLTSYSTSPQSKVIAC